MLFSILLVLSSAPVAVAQTGMIAGRATDAETGEALVGASVSLAGAPTHATTTDQTGHFTIIGVQPGTHTVRAVLLGFVPKRIEDVRVSTGLVTRLEFRLQRAAPGLDEIVVSAETSLFRPDASANLWTLTPEELHDLPLAGLPDVIEQLPGVEPGLQFRGGGSGETALFLDGMSTRTGREQLPITSISLTSIEEVQVQSGGFSAEYGNLRSGLVNLATKQPSRTRYTFDGLFRYTPPQPRAFEGLTQLPDQCGFTGRRIDPNCDAYWARPLLDPRVNTWGTSWRDGEGWDRYTRREYRTFVGLVGYVEHLRSRGFDVTVEDVINYSWHTHRKDNTIDAPDYDVDMTLAGPLLPGVNARLGDARFLASYRGTRTAYLHPQTRRAFRDDAFQAKLLANPRPDMTLSLHGLWLRERGQNMDPALPDVRIWRGDLPAYPWSPLGVAQLTGVDAGGSSIYTDGQVALADVDHNLVGLRFSHSLSTRTYYEAGIQRVSSNYRSRFPNLRDGSYVCPSSGVGPDGQACSPGDFVPLPWTDGFGMPVPGFEDELRCFGGVEDVNRDGVLRPFCVGTEPFGFSGEGGTLVTGMPTGGDWVQTRDRSSVHVWTGRIDLTSQINRTVLFRTGAELIYSDYDVDFARVNLATTGRLPQASFRWQEAPIQGALYAQSRLEHRSIVANLGLRLDYFDVNTDWWEVWTPEWAFLTSSDDLEDALPRTPTETQTSISPRIGISFPVTDDDKVFFNYGHFRQMLDPQYLFGIERSADGSAVQVGNPGQPMPRTIAYEVGYDRNVFDLVLLRVSAFHRDVSLLARPVDVIGEHDVVYVTQRPSGYEDVQGLEISVSRPSHHWIRGSASFTFLRRKSGRFGLARIYEDTREMHDYLAASTDHLVHAPASEPFARIHLVVASPADFGPRMGTSHPLGDWTVSLLGEWRRGRTFTWRGGGALPDVEDNVRWADFRMLDVRLARHVNTPAGPMQFFVDVDNALNLRHLYKYAAFFGDATESDFEYYMRSLHLPADVFDQSTGDPPYMWIPGNDRPGDFRKPGVEWQPIEAVATLPARPLADGARAWYWSQESGRYYLWQGPNWQQGEWQPVPEDALRRVLDQKAYIEMPRLRFNTFLNPRLVRLGMRVSL